MTERDFWIALRRAILLMVDAIDRRYELGKYAKPVEARQGPTDTVTIVPNVTLVQDQKG